MGFAKNDAGADTSRVDEKVNDALKEYFRPEFLNRVDEVVVFHSLTKESIVKIVEVLLEKVKERTSAINLKLTVTDAAILWLANKGYDKVLGARPIRRLISGMIEDPISELVLSAGILSGQEAVIVTSSDESTLEIVVKENLKLAPEVR